MVLSRRAFLSHAAIAAGLGVLPVRLALADAAGDRRLVVVLLRGGMDGLAAVPPVGDRYYKEIRRDLAVAPAAQLDGRFGVLPSRQAASPASWGISACCYDRHGRGVVVRVVGDEELVGRCLTVRR